MSSFQLFLFKSLFCFHQPKSPPQIRPKSSQTLENHSQMQTKLRISQTNTSQLKQKSSQPDPRSSPCGNGFDCALASASVKPFSNIFFCVVVGTFGNINDGDEPFGVGKLPVVRNFSICGEFNASICTSGEPRTGLAPPIGERIIGTV